MDEGEERLSSVSVTALACRDMGHDWPRGDGAKFVILERRRAKILQVGRDLTCRNCGTVRMDVYEYPSFELVGRKYKYTAHYLVNPKDAGKYIPTRQDVRRVLFKRAQ